ncbi:MAG: DUF763 domain-containing protein [Candidatus Hydrogenedentota bacterium]
MRRGIANLPLHNGYAPRWLFDRMVRLAKEIVKVIVTDFSPEELLRRLSDPFWFQAFGCVLGFDWHSSGITTTVCGAVKQGLKDINKELGIYVAGGKGKTSRKTPQEIENYCSILGIDSRPLVYASKLSAKVDNSAVQDGYQLYHHCFIFTTQGRWCVVQQGMNENNCYARRYHWFSDTLYSFVNEPHNAVCCDLRKPSLNMVAAESIGSRDKSVEIANIHPEKLTKEVSKVLSLTLPQRHEITIDDINSKRLQKILVSTYEQKPENYESLLGLQGVGPKTVRALALIAELIYGTKASYKDPARYSFAHGGKDGYPYPVNREVYDNSIHYLKECINSAKIEYTEKKKAFQRLKLFVNL